MDSHHSERVRSTISSELNCFALLCFNCFGDVWALLSRFTKFDQLMSYKLFLQDNFSFYVDLLLATLGFFIFFFAIIRMIWSKLSIDLLEKVIIISLLDALYMFYGSIRIVFDGNTKEKWVNGIQISGDESYYSFMLLISVLLMSYFLFKIYSTFIFFSYKLEIKRKHVQHVRQVHDTPPARQHGSSAGSVQNTAPPYSMSPQLPCNSQIILHRPPTQPSQNLNQPLNAPFSLSQQPSVPVKFPYNSPSIPLTLSNRNPSQSPQFPYQSPSIPFTSSSQSASESIRFPYNPSNVPLTLANQYPSEHLQFPYQSPSIPFSSPSQSASKKIEFPYNSPNIPLGFN